MAARRPTGSGPKDGATSPQARATAFGDRLSQLENDMAEIRDGTMKDVQLLKFEIEEINRRFDAVDRTGSRYESDLADLRRQVERNSTLPTPNQQAGTFPIPTYSGERSSLSRFLNQFHAWALSSRSEDALSHSRPVILTGDKSRRELEIEYGRQIVAQSLTVWTGLTKAVEKDRSIADLVVRAKAPSEAWKILKSMVEDDSSDRAKEQAKKNFEGLSMDSAESMKEYIARAKSLALNVQYHDVEVTDQEISRRVLNGLPPSYAPEKRNFALKTVVIFKSQVKERYDSPSPDDLESRAISSQIQALSGSLVAKSSCSSDRCLLHWRPPCGALDRFLGRLHSMYSSPAR